VVGIMSLDGQVLVIAFFAVALKLVLWSKEEDVAVVDVAPDRKDVLHLDDSGPRLPGEARPDGAEGIFSTSLSPRLEGGRNV
jgi:hypothetical protein